MEDQVHAVNRWLMSRQQAAHQQRALRNRRADLEHRIQHVLDYRNSLIDKRDRKNAQIPLRPAEQRMWDNKIALADESIAALRAELSAL